MLPENMRPVPGDDAGNNMKWDSLVLDTEFSLEWMNPAFKITFTTSPSYFSIC